MIEEQSGHEINNSKFKLKQRSLRKRSFALLLAFVAGIIVSWLVTYTVIYKYLSDDRNDSAATSQSQLASRDAQSSTRRANLESPTAKPQVSDEEVRQYTETVDCSTLSQNSKLTIDANRVKMHSVDLERSQINIQFFESASSTDVRSLGFMTLPGVVDYKCSPIKLSDLKAGQTIRLYDYNAAALREEPEKRSYIQLIQKITR